MIGPGTNDLEGTNIVIAAEGGDKHYISLELEDRTVLGAETNSSGELSCKDAREFWLSWENGLIQVKPSQWRHNRSWRLRHTWTLPIIPLANSREIMKAPHNWLFVMDSTSVQSILLTKGQ